MRPDRAASREKDPTWRRYLRFLRPNPAADLDDELRDHMESTVEELIRTIHAHPTMSEAVAEAAHAAHGAAIHS